MKYLNIFIVLCLTASLFSFKLIDKNKLTDTDKAGLHANLLNEGYTVDKFYKKTNLEYGTLGENGEQIEFIFVKTSVDAGDYEIELADGPSELYEIKGTDMYLTFNGYFGYAGYGTECILRVEYYSSTVYKIE